MKGPLPSSPERRFTETLEKTIEVDQPVKTVYDLWTQFENFPRFMSGIKEVRQRDAVHLHWKAEIGGKIKEWDAEIYDQVPCQRIAWRSTGGAENCGTIHFIALSPTRTRIILYLSYGPKGLVEWMASDHESRLRRRSLSGAPMELADLNADELPMSLYGRFHRLRQSGIDEALLDVVFGFEALGGPGPHPTLVICNTSNNISPEAIPSATW